MITPFGFDRCLSFINCQLQPAKPGEHRFIDGQTPRAVTLSREAGSGAHVIGEKLAGILDKRCPNTGCHWTVFDKNLVEKVLEDHKLPSRLAQFMREDRISAISDTMDELFNLHPPSSTLVRKTSDTILHLAELGNVILIGRGAVIITRKLNYMFHVRLVGSLERRVAHVMDYMKVSREAAMAFVTAADRGRRRYAKKYFNLDIDDPLLYHLVINTDAVPYDEAAQLIADAMLRRKVPV